MSKSSLAALSAIVFVGVCAALAQAEDIAAKKIMIKDNTDTTKRQIQLQSKDVGVELSEADDPSTNGAAVHVYSTTDDYCVQLPGGPSWENTGTKWKYKDTGTKNTAQIADGKLKVKIKADDISFSLNEATQGTVNAQVQFGTGTRYCLRCPGNTKDQPGKFIGKACTASACAAEPSTCNPPGATTTTTTTTTTTSTTTTTCAPPTAITVKGSLTATKGRFNYCSQLGLPAANTCCSNFFPGSHPCEITELQGAPASDLACLKDTSNNTVTSLWAIDPTRPALAQCVGAAPDPPNNWLYNTAHTLARGDWIMLNNSLGTLGSLQTGEPCTSPTHWVACCQ